MINGDFGNLLRIRGGGYLRSLARTATATRASRARYDDHRGDHLVGASRLDISAGLSASRPSRRRAIARAPRAVAADWREKAKPIEPGSAYPAKEHCSQCGLCDTYYVAHVKDACAFLGDGMSRIETLEPVVHGRGRDLSNDEMRLGVVDEVVYAKRRAPVPGAQWTGIITSIACEMLRSGKVEGVICVASQPDNDMEPRPILATTVEEILSSKGSSPASPPTPASSPRWNPAGSRSSSSSASAAPSPPSARSNPTSASTRCTSWAPTARTTAGRRPSPSFSTPRPRTPTRWCTTSSCKIIRCTSSTRTGASRRCRTFASRPTSSRTSSRPRATAASITSTGWRISWWGTWACRITTRT